MEYIFLANALQFFLDGQNAYDQDSTYIHSYLYAIAARLVEGFPCGNVGTDHLCSSKKRLVDFIVLA